MTVEDETGSCRLVVWEEDVNSLEEGKSYCLVNVGVRKYEVSEYLSFSSRSSVKVIDDLEEVNEEDIVGDNGLFIKGDISAVLSSTEYLSCRFCRSKIVPDDEILGECSKCCALMKVSTCEKTKSAKVVVAEESSSGQVTLSVVEPMLS